MATAGQDREKLSVVEIGDGLPEDFRHLANHVAARYRTRDFVSAQALAAAIGEAAEEDNHHPDLLVGWGYVEARLASHDVGGVTRRDLRLAHRISALARDAGAHPEPGALQQVEWGLDTWADAEVLPFWRAILGYDESVREHEAVDSTGRGPTVWFQDTDEHETPRQRWHPDIWVPVDQAETRIAAALAAGGSLVDDSEAPSFWVLADPQGNRACICTVQDRG
ncbi:VOC family protein [Nocardioides sp.]|jgi:4a-hydroxytetrahydrobiopterin dehydratase|uniref:VOC family protein n=1 Tax=Nocardioides sp. TaxID=35761 RepID=UPI002BEA78F9|nr:VOC family protein [Nocardioides sp.]HVX53129.1 VOC family protein [Nocardioides sp.]